ncbi:MAG: glycosyltransferase family 2 protein [Planctomycetota bacterium]
MPAEQRPDYVLLLNPDTVVRPGAIAALVDFLEAHPTAGLAGSRLEDPDGTLQASSFRFPSIASEFNGQLRFGPVHKLLSRWATVSPQPQDGPSPTDWVAGASLMVRASVLADIGLMDEAYFLYYEETDFCLRAAQAGWSCHYVPSSKVVHLVGQSSGVTNPGDRAKRLPQFWFESRARFLAKHHGWWSSKAIDLAAFAGFALGRLKRHLSGQNDQDPAQFAGDLWRLSLNAERAAHPAPVQPSLPEPAAEPAGRKSAIQ